MAVSSRESPVGGIGWRKGVEWSRVGSAEHWEVKVEVVGIRICFVFRRMERELCIGRFELLIREFAAGRALLRLRVHDERRISWGLILATKCWSGPGMWRA